jgi:hypothetical protein
LLKVAFNIIQETLANKIFRKAWVISVWLHFQYCSVNPTVIWLWQRKPLNINIQTINTSCHYVHCKGHVNKWKFGAFLIKKIVKFLSENNLITIRERGKYLKVQRNCMQTAILIWLLVRRCGIICFVNMCCSVFSAHFMTNNNKFVNY